MNTLNVKYIYIADHLRDENLSDLILMYFRRQLIEVESTFI